MDKIEIKIENNYVSHIFINDIDISWGICSYNLHQDALEKIVLDIECNSTCLERILNNIKKAKPKCITINFKLSYIDKIND